MCRDVSNVHRWTHFACRNRRNQTDESRVDEVTTFGGETALNMSPSNTACHGNQIIITFGSVSRRPGSYDYPKEMAAFQNDEMRVCLEAVG